LIVIFNLGLKLIHPKSYGRVAESSRHFIIRDLCEYWNPFMRSACHGPCACAYGLRTIWMYIQRCICIYPLIYYIHPRRCDPTSLHLVSISTSLTHSPAREATRQSAIVHNSFQDSSAIIVSFLLISHCPSKSVVSVASIDADSPSSLPDA
jgi:hypothetical protein